MAVINKQKTLDDIETLAANTHANILVLDNNNEIKKLALIDESGSINANLINIQTVENKIAELNTVISSLTSALKTISDTVFAIQGQVDMHNVTFMTFDDSIKKLASQVEAHNTALIAIDDNIKKLSEIRPLPLTTEITEDSKPAKETVKKTVKKPRKTTKKASSAE